MNDPKLPDLLIELGMEELPAGVVLPAVQGLRDALVALLAGVPHGEVCTYATPRRLAVVVRDLHAAQPATEREVTGPAADKAFSADGTPTEIGASFARGKGADPADLRVVELPKRGRVAAVTIREGGTSVIELIRDGLAGIIERLPFPKRMVWGEGGLAFSRPLHRVLAVYDHATIEGEAHGIAFTNETVGHRLTPGPMRVGNEQFWLASLRSHHVEPDVDVRRARVRALLAEVQDELGCDPIVNDELLEEVVQLVEWPVKVVGTFDADLLGLPPRLLVTSMRVHQRYFPVFRDDELTNRFVVVGNNPFADPAVVAEGNARVLRARFFDARFFLKEDAGKRLEQHGEKLASMRWIRGLGTMADKGARLAVIGRAISPALGADAEAVARAAVLAKCDLATQMVGEFPELQGHMGMLYARDQGELPAVSAAIEAHYLPRFSGDVLPATAEGRALAVAERLDTLVGCFGVGIEPSSGGDPQGLRRAAAGLLALLADAGAPIDLTELLATAVRAFQASVRSADPVAFDVWIKARGDGEQARDASALVDRLVGFVLVRFKASQVERGRSTDVVEAAVAAADGGPLVVPSLAARVEAVASLAGTERFVAILQTVKRLLNIVEQATDAPPDVGVEPVEIELLAASRAADAVVSDAAARGDWQAALAAAVGLAEPVERFFVGVMVNDPDPAVRSRRIGILRGVAAIFRKIADFSRISTR